MTIEECRAILKRMTDYVEALTAAQMVAKSDDAFAWRRWTSAVQKTVTRFTRLVDEFDRRGAGDQRDAAALFLRGSLDAVKLTPDPKSVPVLLELARLGACGTDIRELGETAQSTLFLWVKHARQNNDLLPAIVDAAISDIEDEALRSGLETTLLQAGPTVVELLAERLGGKQDRRVIDILARVGQEAFGIVEKQLADASRAAAVLRAMFEIWPDQMEMKLMDRLTDPHTDIRQEAARQVRGLTPPIRHRLEHWLGAGADSQDAAVAFEVLCRLGAEQSAALLLSYVRKLPPERQFELAEKLASLRDTWIVQWLEQSLTLWPVEHAIEIARLLAVRGHPAGRQFIVNHLWSLKGEMRLLAAHAIRNAQNSVPGSFDRAILIEAALQLLTTHKPGSSFGYVAEIMIPTIVPSDPRLVRELIKVLKQNAPFEMRRAAADALGGLGDLGAVKYLFPLDQEEFNAGCQMLHAERAIQKIAKRNKVKITPNAAEKWAAEWEEKHGPI